MERMIELKGQYSLVISNREASAESVKTFESTNPATGALLASVAAACRDATEARSPESVHGSNSSP